MYGVAFHFSLCKFEPWGEAAIGTIGPLKSLERLPSPWSIFIMAHVKIVKDTGNSKSFIFYKMGRVGAGH